MPHCTLWPESWRDDIGRLEEERAGAAVPAWRQDDAGLSRRLCQQLRYILRPQAWQVYRQDEHFLCALGSRPGDSLAQCMVELRERLTLCFRSFPKGMCSMRSSQTEHLFVLTDHKNSRNARHTLDRMQGLEIETADQIGPL